MRIFMKLSVLGLAWSSFAAPVPQPDDQNLSPSQLENLEEIEARQYPTTENDITDGSPCKDLTVIFARGTNEFGNVGALAGPQFFQALHANFGVGQVALQGVNYSAQPQTVYTGGDPAGSQNMADLVNKTASRCPNTKINMSGYSQGGQLVHNAAKLLSPTLTAKIDSVIIFGDPDNGEPVGNIPSSKVLIICHSNDVICSHGYQVRMAHVTYSRNAQQAATFVGHRSGLTRQWER